MWWEENRKNKMEPLGLMLKIEQRMVHSDAMKLWILLRKVKADFLGDIKDVINIEISKSLMTMTHDNALIAFGKEANKRYPPRIILNVPTRCHIRETCQSDRGTGSVRYQLGRRGRKGRVLRQSSSYFPKTSLIQRH